MIIGVKFLRLARACRGGDYLKWDANGKELAKWCSKMAFAVYEVHPDHGENWILNAHFHSNHRGRGRGFILVIFVQTGESDVPEETTARVTDATTSLVAPRISFTCGRLGRKDHKVERDVNIGEVVDGSVVERGAVPWQVGLYVYKHTFNPFCGGTLISPSHVLTAAHCVDKINPRFVVVSEHDVSRPDGEVWHSVKCVRRHPKHTSGSSDYDFAMIVLRTPVAIGPRSSAAPACLPSDPSADYANETLTVSGWGRIEEGGRPSFVLRSVSIPGLSNEECRQFYGHRITDRMMCAGHAKGGKDACQGDSGGPLTHQQDGTMTLVGVVSWGSGCARPRYPGVYGRVTSVLDWISGFKIHNKYPTCLI